MSLQIATQLKIDDHFVEEDYGVRVLCRVTEEPTTEMVDLGNKDKLFKQVKWKAKIVQADDNYKLGEEVSYCITEGHEGYGPRIRIEGSLL